ncbi:hypothetical protein NECID01_1177 [Nematocida sp. AWRm77]|nr:hypothetical protein NECID01_1177 [Nematocida sp. AWRm77]
MNRTKEDVFEQDILEEFTRRRIKELACTGVLKEIDNEELLIEKAKKDTLVVHFYNGAFPRCVEMNKALEQLAPKFPQVEFLSASAGKFPKVTGVLEIEQLPYLASFTQGLFLGGIIGFQDIGEEKLDVGLLEQYIRQSKLLEKDSK